MKKTTVLKKAIINVLFFAAILSSCNVNKSTDKIPTIRINPYEAQKEINLSEFVDSVKYIKLQTDANCVMGRIVFIRIKQKYIYVFDAGQKIIFVFDKKGRYVSKLDKRGKGPKEYMHINGVFIDDNEKFIEIYDAKGILLKYSNISFDLLEKHPMDRVISNSFRKINDYYYFATQQIRNYINKKPTNANILIVKNGKIVKTLFDRHIETNNITYVPFLESFTVNDKKELFVSIMYDNTFYQLRDLDAYPVFTIDFGKYAMDKSVGMKPIKEQMLYLRKNTDQKAFFPVLDINNSNIIAFNYLFNESNNHIHNYEFIQLKKINKTFHTKRIKNDITAFPEYVTLSTSGGNICHEVWYEDYLVNIINPGNLFLGNSGEDRKNINGLGIITQEDNPIIVLMKLKKELK